MGFEDPERTPGDLEWEETHDFFSAEELKTAGWDFEACWGS